MQKQLINVDERTKNINKNKIIRKTMSKNKSFIKFHFLDGEEICIDKNNFLSLNPSLLNNNNISIQNLSENSFQINLPKYIKKEEFSFFLLILEKFPKSLKECLDIKGDKILELLKISDYFCNEEFNARVINELVLPFNYDNIIIDLLNYSYKKLCIKSEQKEEANNIYFDLFYQSLENISKNELIVLNNLDKIKLLDKKIIDEIIEKTFQNLIYGTTLLIEPNNENNNVREELQLIPNELATNNIISPLTNNSSKQTHILKDKQFKELIYLLMEIKNKTNFFDLLTSEYAFLLSKDSINELKNLPHPSLQVDIHFSDYSFYSQEFPLEIILNHKKIILVVSYKKSDQSFNVCLKLSNNNNIPKTCNSILEIDKISEEKFIEDNSCFKIFTFLTHVIITKGPEKIKIATQNNLLSLSNNKSIYSILKISNFDNELRNFLIREPEKEYFSVIIHIKLCYIYSALASFLLKEFTDYSQDANICKISKQLLILILENKYMHLKDKDIVQTILLWMQDEMNIKEDISSVFDLIKWENIDDNIIFELIIKYAHIIVGNSILEKKFTDAFEKKYNNPVITENILKSLFIAGKKIDYSRVYSKMKKSEKYNKAYKFFNSDAKLKGNIFGIDNSSLSKDSCSFKEGMQHIFMNNSFININQNTEEKSKKIDNNKISNIINSINNTNENTLNLANNNSNKKSIEKDSNTKTNKEISLNIIKNKEVQNNKSNTKENVLFKKKDINKINLKKKGNEQIIFCDNNANFLKKNLSFLNIKQQQKQPVKPNISKKNIKNNDIKKLSFSYIKNNSNQNSIHNKNNISNFSININNISNINISNNNFSNFKTHNNDYDLKNYNKTNGNLFSLTFLTGKSQEKNGNSKNIDKKYEKNFPLKIFSTANNEINKHNNFIKKNLHNNVINEITDNNNIKKNSLQKTQKNSKKFNSLLSTILNYDKLMNKSKIRNRSNINTSSIRKMIMNKNQKNKEKKK